MKGVYKITQDRSHTQKRTLSIQPFAKPISCGEDSTGQLAIWFEAEAAPPTWRIDVHSVMTGQDVPEGMRFLGTVIYKNGLGNGLNFVTHVYVSDAYDAR